MRSAPGFTLLELLLVVALMGIVTGAGFLVARTSVLTDTVSTASRISMQAMRRAQRSAWSMRNDSDWGVSISSRSATVFRGDSFSGREPGYDEAFPFPLPVEVGETTEFVFRKGSGDPDTIATVSFTYEDVVHRISVSGQGTLHYHGP